MGQNGGVNGPKILLRLKNMCDEQHREYVARAGGKEGVFRVWNARI